jgi:hypothetical protein
VDRLEREVTEAKDETIREAAEAKSETVRAKDDAIERAKLDQGTYGGFAGSASAASLSFVA